MVKVELNTKAPDSSLEDYEGKSISLSDYSGKKNLNLPRKGRHEVKLHSTKGKL